MKKTPFLITLALGLSFASLYGQNDAVTAPVAVDPAALEAARVRPAEVRPAQVPEEMERFRVRPLEQIMGHDLRAQREALDRRAATRSGQWAEEAAKRSAEAAEQAEELGLPMTWTDQRGTVRKFLGFDDRGIFQFLESHGAYQLMQGGVVDIQADGSMGYPYSGTFKPLGFWELQLPRVTHENFEDVATSDPRMVIAPNQTAATNTDHATRVGDVLIGTGLGFDSLTGDWALGGFVRGYGHSLGPK